MLHCSPRLLVLHFQSIPLLSHSSHYTVYAVPDLSPPSSRHPLPDLPEPVITAGHSYHTAGVHEG